MNDSGAGWCSSPSAGLDDSRNALTCAELCDSVRRSEPVCETAGDGIRTHDVQLGNRKGLNTSDDAASGCARQTEGPNYTPDNSAGIATNDDRLRRVVAPWPGLPDAIKAAVLVLVDTVTNVTGTKTPADVADKAGFGDGAGG
jgi:hypothetical protein